MTDDARFPDPLAPAAPVVTAPPNTTHSPKTRGTAEVTQQPWGQPPQQYPPQQWGPPQTTQQPWGPPPQQQQQPHRQDTRSANDILMGGGGAPAWVFEAPGVRKVARIVKPPQSRQEREYVKDQPGAGKPKFFPSGDPIMGVTVEVQTNERDPSDPDDDGKRTFYIEGKRLKEAVREAVRATGCNGLEVGGTLDVTLTHYDEPNDRKSGRNWAIVYTPAGNNVLMESSEVPHQAPPRHPGGPFQDQGQPTTPLPPQGGFQPQQPPAQNFPPQPPQQQPFQYQGGYQPPQQQPWDEPPPF